MAFQNLEQIVSNSVVLPANDRFNSFMTIDVGSAQSFLLEEFQRRVRLNPRYSLRSYARALGLSPGALSEVLRRRRPLSLKTAAKIIKSLGLSGLEADKLYSFIEDERRGSIEGALFDKPAARKLDEDTFHLVAEWQHFAILNLMNCEGFVWRASHIAKRLGLGVAQADHAMKLLLRVGLVKKTNRGFECAHDFVLSPEGVSSAAVRAYHRQMLDKAIQALELQSIDDRDITGVGFAVDPAQLAQVKRDISEFQDRLAAKYSKGKRREVYFLEVALFRLSQGGSGHD